MLEQKEESPFETEVAEAKASDSALFIEASPKGKFSSKALNTLVEATNKLLPLFGQEGNYPRFDAGTYEVWPEDFVRIISMFSEASKDAVSDDIFPNELIIDFSNARSDADVQLMAGKISAMAKSIPFKKWLKEVPEKKEAEPASKEVPDGEMKETDIEELFMNRM